MGVIYICFVLCFAIEAALCRVVDNEEDIFSDLDDNSTIVHNLQRRDMQSSTVGCRLDSASKTMYYFVKFGRYFTWLMEDKLEMVVRYADNEPVAGQQVAESEVLVFVKNNTHKFQEKYGSGDYFCLPPGKIGEAKGCVECNIMCVHFKGMKFVGTGELVFPVQVFLGKCKDAFENSDSPSILKCMMALDEKKYCYVHEYRIFETEYNW